MRTVTTIGILVLVSAFAVGAYAEPQMGARKNEQNWGGTLTAVNAQDNTVTGQHWWSTETFHAGKNCAIVAVDKKEAALSDLRPGEKVKIRYQDVEGVRVADRIVERALHDGGTVQAVDAKAGTVTMQEPPLYKPFRAPETLRIADDCKVVLANGDEGTLADVRPGDRVTVIYELPGDSRVAYRIRDRSSSLVATLDAVDLSARTVKIKQKTGEETFQLADKCRIIASNQQREPLKDLALGQQYRFTYRDVNGVNVLDQITPAQETKPAETASTGG
jgi:hypothetical protein